MSRLWIFKPFIAPILQIRRKFSLLIVGESVRMSVVSSSKPRATRRALTFVLPSWLFCVKTHRVLITFCPLSDTSLKTLYCFHLSSSNGWAFNQLYRAFNIKDCFRCNFLPIWNCFEIDRFHCFRMDILDIEPIFVVTTWWFSHLSCMTDNQKLSKLVCIGIHQMNPVMNFGNVYSCLFWVNSAAFFIRSNFFRSG